MSLPDEFIDSFTCGNCFEWLDKLPQECIDLVLTDPPYGIDYQSNRRVAREKLPKFQNDVDLSWIDTWVDQVFRVLKNDRHFYCFTRFDTYPTFYNAISRRFKVKNCLIWAKNNHGSGDLNGSYAPMHEMIIFASKGLRHLKGARDGDVLECENVPSAYRKHATQKPRKLLRQLIEASTDANEFVLDPFAGTGSTGFACNDLSHSGSDQHRRHFVLFELNEVWVYEARIGGLGRQEVLFELPAEVENTPRRQRQKLRLTRFRPKKTSQQEPSLFP